MRIPTRATMSLVLAGALVAACSGAAAPRAPAADLVAGSSGGCDGTRPRGYPGGRDARTHPEEHHAAASPTPRCATTDGQGAEVVRGVEIRR